MSFSWWKWMNTDCHQNDATPSKNHLQHLCIPAAWEMLSALHDGFSRLCSSVCVHVSVWLWGVPSWWKLWRGSYSLGWYGFGGSHGSDMNIRRDPRLHKRTETLTSFYINKVQTEMHKGPGLSHRRSQAPRCLAFVQWFCLIMTSLWPMVDWCLVKQRRHMHTVTLIRNKNIENNKYIKKIW